MGERRKGQRAGGECALPSSHCTAPRSLSRCIEGASRGVGGGGVCTCLAVAPVKSWSIQRHVPDKTVLVLGHLESIGIEEAVPGDHTLLYVLPERCRCPKGGGGGGGGGVWEPSEPAHHPPFITGRGSGPSPASTSPGCSQYDSFREGQMTPLAQPAGH